MTTTTRSLFFAPRPPVDSRRRLPVLFAAVLLLLVGTVAAAPPKAVDDTLTVAEDSAPTVVDVLANDSDPDGDTLTVTHVTQPSDGTVTLVGGVVSFAPSADFFGTTEFDYIVNDGTGATARATVTVTVTPVPDAPKANDDSVTVLKDSGAVVIDVLGNDTDADGDALTVTAVTQPANGTVTLIGGVVRFTPAGGFTGATSFDYTISDGNGGTDSATVTVNVALFKHLPLFLGKPAISGTGVVGELLEVVDTEVVDLDGDTLVLSYVWRANGFTIVGATMSTYTPTPEDIGKSITVVVRASDGTGSATATTAGVTVVGRPPVARGDSYVTQRERLLTIAAPGVLANDSEGNGGELHAVLVSGPSHGLLTLASDGGFSYRPAKGFAGQDDFVYKACDDAGGCHEATVSLRVDAVNDAPVARPDRYAIQIGETLTVAAPGFLANDSDREGDSLIVGGITYSGPGQLTTTPNGSLTYVPAPGFEGEDRFTYRVCDLSDECSEGTVYIGVGRHLSAADQYVWMATPAENSQQQSFVRLTNREDRGGQVLVWGVDANGQRSDGTLAFDLEADESRQFNSQQLEFGDPATGLFGGLRADEGTTSETPREVSNRNWMLVIRTELDMDVMAYIRTPDGFVTSMHDTVAGDGVDWLVPMFNPADNLTKISRLRLVNTHPQPVDVVIAGADDAGMPGESDVRATLVPFASLELLSTELESGSVEKGVTGRLGDGTGKWRLTVSATAPIQVQSLLADSRGYLTNLSSVPAVGDEAGVRRLWLVPPASETQQQGFVRIVNPTDEAQDVEVYGIDSAGQRSEGTLSLSVPAQASKQFNAQDMEAGNPAKGLTGSLGSGEGAWTLVLSLPDEMLALSYIRTPDDFLTSMHDIVAKQDEAWRVPFFNPARNVNQVSELRLVNPSASPVMVAIAATDDAGLPAPEGSVSITVAAKAAVTLTSPDLENGNAAKGLVGKLGAGTGKWRLDVTANGPLTVINLLRDPNGYLTNLSNRPRARIDD